ncbi:MAG: DUF3108 domain-containing protein [Ignavibacteriales bacterium CG_4_9_14_3_um_filter_30_11]|nr:MAG: DUF3108 domain-containing protein [Ignavibacteriales bacterium CG_4_9_14_3_um_filter_30_11]
MKKKFQISNLVLIIFLIYAFCNNAQTKADSFRVINNNAFKMGENLTFKIKYGFVTAGISKMYVKDEKTISGRLVNHVIFEVNSVPSFDWIYKVRDRYETFIDKEGLFPWRFEQHIREGGYKRDYSAYFDQRQNKAFTSEGIFDIPEYVNDIISAFYLARIFDYTNSKENDEIHLKNFSNGKTFDLDVVFRGREEIEVPAGKFSCIIIEPLVKGGGLFKSEGSIYIWLSDDSLKVPIKVKSKIVVGSIDAVLSEYSGLAGEFKAKIPE